MRSGSIFLSLFLAIVLLASSCPVSAESPWRDGFSVSRIDSALEERISGLSYHPGYGPVGLEDLRYLTVLYYDFNGEVHNGELICNKAIAEDLIEIFEALYDAGYQLRSVRLVDDFGADDERSMAADNTSCFNCRKVAGSSHFSGHAYGMAIDINPLENPYVRGSVVSPAGSAPYVDRSQKFKHKIDTEDLCYRLFREKGFAWGGAWRSLKDYQHFEKRQ